MNLKLTNAGKELLLSALSGEKLIFTHAEYGIGRSDGDVGQLAVPKIKCDFSSSERQSGDGYFKLAVKFTNAQISEPLLITEAGYFAKKENGEEILYAYGTTSDESADRIPPKSERDLTITYNVLIFVSEAENISVVIGENNIYASSAAFAAHLADGKNPHKVSKADVGLEKVANEYASDLPLEFSEEIIADADKDAFENLYPKSGERVKNILRKVLMLFRLFDAHKNAKNPHGTQAHDIGAAEEEHTHAASDINSGILPPARGGTGCASIADLGKALEKAGALPEFKIDDLVIEHPTGEGGGTCVKKTFKINGSPRIIIVCQGVYGVAFLTKGHIERAYLTLGSSTTSIAWAEWNTDVSLTIETGFYIYPDNPLKITCISIY